MSEPLPYSRDYSAHFVEPTDPRGDRRLAFRTFLVLDTVFIAVMSLLAFLAPCGRWTNKIFGIGIWDNSDPGGPYVVSALSFFKSGYPPYVAGSHPGSTLQLLIAVMAESVFGAAKLFGSSADYLGFWAKHVTLLFALSSVMMAIAHVVSFHLLYLYVKRILNSTRLALIAVVAYATCFPTLYYGTRVSTEPLLVSLTLITFLTLDNCAVVLSERRWLSACVNAAIAGAASMVAVYTKLHLAFSLPVVVLMQLALQTRPDRAPLVKRVRESLLPLLSAVVAIAGTFALGLLKVHWPTFFDFWRRFTPGKPPRNRDLTLFQQYTSEWSAMAIGTVKALATNVQLHFSRSYQGLFTVADGLFVIGALVGTVILWRSRPHLRGRILWPIILCISLMPILVFRGVWHYYVVHLAFGSIGFAVTIAALVRRFVSADPKRLLRFALLATLVVHVPAFLFVAAAKAHDIRMFREQYAVPLSALKKVPYRTYLVVVTGKTTPPWLKYPWLMYGGYPTYVDPRSTPFVTTFARQIRYVADPSQLTRANLRRWKAAFVLDLRGSKPVLKSTRRWPVAAPTTVPTSAPTSGPATAPSTAPAR